MQLQFYKYHGTGNDFILFDNREKLLEGDEYHYFADLCHRRFGIGADGVILLNAHPEHDFEMDYFNSDGNRSTMCGNGGRCIVQFARRLGIVRDKARFTAIDGLHEAGADDMLVRLKMAVSRSYETLENGDYRIDTGSPHYVRFLDTAVLDYDVFTIGRQIRHTGAWEDKGINVNFAQETGEGELYVRTYERGVEDETLSCGTGVTAVAEVYARARRPGTREVRITTPGGRLAVHVEPGKAPWLEGPAVFVFEGRIEGPKNSAADA